MEKVIPQKVLKMLERRRKASEALIVASVAVDNYCKSIGLDPVIYADDACLITNILIYTEPGAAERRTKDAIEKALNGRMEDIEPWNA